jgi:hypothetical protein
MIQACELHRTFQFGSQREQPACMIHAPLDMRSLRNVKHEDRHDRGGRNDPQQEPQGRKHLPIR